MISKEALIRYLLKSMPDAQIEIVDRTGTMDHYQISIVSSQFDGQNLLDRQRSVYRALDEPMRDGRIHALEIKSMSPLEAASRQA